MKTILSESKNKQVVDPITGELINETITKTFYVKAKEEPFIMTYVKSLSMIYNIKSAAAIRVLYKLLELSNFNNNEVQVTAPKKKEILKDLDISEPSFVKSIQILKDKNIISGSRGLYYINENVF